MVADAELIETGNGGDLVLIATSGLNPRGYINIVGGWSNMIYLAMFGGNVAQDTAERNAGEQSFDWWANALLHPNDESIQMNSQTERTLNSVSLTSSGRLKIEQAIAKDLAFMSAFSTVTISTKITAPDRLEISIKVTKPEQLGEQIFIYLWDSLTQTIT